MLFCAWELLVFVLKDWVHGVIMVVSRAERFELLFLSLFCHFARPCYASIVELLYSIDTTQKR
jgi:hypothetical protein